MSRKPRHEHCTYCRRKLEGMGTRSGLAATLDHVLPKSKGGRGVWLRKVWCCRQCNSIKADMMPDKWSAFMADNPEWWLMEKYRDRGRAHKQRTFYAAGVPRVRFDLRS